MVSNRRASFQVTTSLRGAKRRGNPYTFWAGSMARYKLELIFDVISRTLQDTGELESFRASSTLRMEWMTVE